MSSGVNEFQSFVSCNRPLRRARVLTLHHTYAHQLLFAYFTKLFRDEQNIQIDGEGKGALNNGVDSIPCEGGLVVKRTQVSAPNICLTATSVIARIAPAALTGWPCTHAKVVFSDPETKAETKLVCLCVVCPHVRSWWGICVEVDD